MEACLECINILRDNNIDIPKGANDDEIKRIFRKWAQKNHPDKGGDSEQFQNVSNCIDVHKECENVIALENMFGSDSSSSEISEINVSTAKDKEPEVEIIFSKKLQDIAKKFAREKKAQRKEWEEMLGGDVNVKKMNETRIRINSTVVLEARPDIIAVALDIKQKSGDAGNDVFYVLDNILPFRVSEKMDPRGEERTQRELDRVIKRIQGEIKKFEKGQLKRGRNIVRKRKLGQFTLLYWPDDDVPKESVKEEVKEPKVKEPEIEEIILVDRPKKTKKFAYFQNFDIPAPSLSSKVNPWKSSQKKHKMMNVKDLLREKGVKVDFSLDDEDIDSKLRKVASDSLFKVLSDIKGLDKEGEEIREESNITNIGPNKYDFIREKVKEFNDAGELEFIGDEVGEKILSDFLAETDPYVKAEMVAYHLRRLDPRISTKDTLVYQQQPLQENFTSQQQQQVLTAMLEEINQTTTDQDLVVGGVIKDKKKYWQVVNAIKDKYRGLYPIRMFKNDILADMDNEIKRALEFKKREEIKADPDNKVNINRKYDTIFRNIDTVENETISKIQQKYFKKYPDVFIVEQKQTNIEPYLISYGLIDYLNKRRGSIEDAIFDYISGLPLDGNYKYILQLGLYPEVIDEFGRLRKIVEPSGFETELFGAIFNLINNREFSEAELREFFVGPVKERISKEQWDIINGEWDIYRVQFDDPADYDSAPSSDVAQSEMDLVANRSTLKNEVEALEESIYAESENVREYVLKVASILAILNLDFANNIKNRINSGAVSVENLYLLTVEEMLPELFLNPDLATDKDYIKDVEMDGLDILEVKVGRNMASRFKKWFDSKIFSEANIIMNTYLPSIKKEWFPIALMPLTFNVEKFKVSEKELCGTLNSNKYYVMTSDGIKCVTADYIRDNLDELSLYNRKDLEQMIED